MWMASVSSQATRLLQLQTDESGSVHKLLPTLKTAAVSCRERHPQLQLEANPVLCHTHA